MDKDCITSPDNNLRVLYTSMNIAIINKLELLQGRGEIGACLRRPALLSTSGRCPRTRYEGRGKFNVKANSMLNTWLNVQGWAESRVQHNGRNPR